MKNAGVRVRMTGNGRNFLMNDDLKARVTHALAAHVGPALEMDGTLLEVLDVADGVARIRLGGVCGNCPSSIMLVVHGFAEELRKNGAVNAYVDVLPRHKLGKP